MAGTARKWAAACRLQPAAAAPCPASVESGREHRRHDVFALLPLAPSAVEAHDMAGAR